MPNKEIISRSYRQFSSADGSQHIASEYALVKLQELIENFQIRSVLEVGLGIGSIAGTLLKLNPALTYTGTESNEFCLQALLKNLGDNYPRLRIYNGLISLPAEPKFDLIIIDGKDSCLERVRELIRPQGIIVIEGDRMPQQDDLQYYFPKHVYAHSISTDKNKAFSPFASENYQGGIKILFIHPTLKQVTWWIKEKFFTKLKYLFRNRLNSKAQAINTN